VFAKELHQHEKYADHVDEDYCVRIFHASPLHDIGKVGIPDHVLQKPGQLTEHEYEVMKTHATLGAETLRAVDREHPGNGFIRIGIEVAECHHERWDGAGYPYGLAGDAIPLSARILALTDVYDALRSKRCYKASYDHAQARTIIESLSGTHFDPRVTAGFHTCEAEFDAIWQRLNSDQL
jgi:putative two-component system response regulator